jgi:hypothetical protein
MSAAQVKAAVEAQGRRRAGFARPAQLGGVSPAFKSKLR